MSDTSNIIPVLQKWLLEDATIGPLCDYQVIAGLNSTLADSYLQSSPYACIGLHLLSKTSSVACFNQGSNPSLKASLLIEIDAYSKVSEANAQAIAVLVENKLQANMVQTFGGVDYDFMVESVSTTPQYDEELATWREIMTVRGIVYYTV
jgi:hypothetical protein